MEFDPGGNIVKIAAHEVVAADDPMSLGKHLFSQVASEEAGDTGNKVCAFILHDMTLSISIRKRMAP